MLARLSIHYTITGHRVVITFRQSQPGISKPALSRALLVQFEKMDLAETGDCRDNGWGDYHHNHDVKPLKLQLCTGEEHCLCLIPLLHINLINVILLSRSRQLGIMST